MSNAKPSFSALVAVKLSSLMDGNAYSGDLIDKVSKSIKGRGVTLDVDMHAAAVAAIHVSMVDRDAGPAGRLINSLPKGTRAKALAEWFAAFSNVVLTYDKKAGIYLPKMVKLGHADEKVADPVKAQSVPFWTPAETVKAGAFDDVMFAKAVASLIKRATHENAVLSPAAMAALLDLKVAAVKMPVPENA